MECKVCCVATASNNKWARIRAYSAGWVELKNGDAYCPEHTPSWYKRWKKQRRHNY